VRQVLARGWRGDVVVRTVSLPPFEPEAVVGVLRKRDGYRAFSIRPSVQIWDEAGYGSTDPNKRVGDYSKVRPVFHDRPLPGSVAARIAAVWRRVLSDKRNYGKDPSIYLDTSTFAFYVSFLHGERLAAHVTGWGRNTKQIILVTEELLTYTTGKSDQPQLLRVLSTAERKVGI